MMVWRPATYVRNIKDCPEKSYGSSAGVASYRSNAASHTSSPRRSIPRAPLQYQGAIARRGIRQPSDEAKQWRGYLNHDARMHSAMRPVSTAGTEIIEYKQNN
ncbi:hypothetical protein EVAR_18100_1 [Eumeta japonica]|uniref:Uncharacterized protein n=1 Tax=Eumeta variegata TaxID=151549 RepID=A0A4C1VI87_EUMVA|nr:hypothetical protein EVAR_18100_1 [Eumeta japonica]